GYIETTRDSLLIFEACKRGLLPRICRRLQDKERQLVQSGTVFCFDENESGIKRWTDGLLWSPSRILGNFLIYRELETKTPLVDEESSDDAKSYPPCTSVSYPYRKQRDRTASGSLKPCYRFKTNGLIKKSMSLMMGGVQQHLISYYNKDDVLADKLPTPSLSPELATMEISTELLHYRHFRVPLFLDEGP
ncbi:Gti1/Pac2 family-domain-containing protein, partial [Radiomyces spectabilis]|uniref:Gti1/Pac2 family-domain-containing protein n=1 Tax=Radiomyces spectabilis TaxID=64574 RepID=UPI00221F42FA